MCMGSIGLTEWTQAPPPGMPRTPYDHSTCNNCIDEDSAEAPVGEGRGEEGEGTEEDAKMGVRGVPCAHGV